MPAFVAAIVFIIFYTGLGIFGYAEAALCKINVDCNPSNTRSVDTTATAGSGKLCGCVCRDGFSGPRCDDPAWVVNINNKYVSQYSVQCASKSITWQQAATSCEMLGKGWALATINSASAQNAISTLGASVSSYTLWLGGSDRASESTFLWQFGRLKGSQFYKGRKGTFLWWITCDVSPCASPSGFYNNFDEDQPSNSGDEDFVQMMTGDDRFWNDVKETQSSSQCFVCERSPCIPVTDSGGFQAGTLRRVIGFYPRCTATQSIPFSETRTPRRTKSVALTHGSHTDSRTRASTATLTATITRAAPKTSTTTASATISMLTPTRLPSPTPKVSMSPSATHGDDGLSRSHTGAGPSTTNTVEMTQTIASLATLSPPQTLSGRTPSSSDIHSQSQLISQTQRHHTTATGDPLRTQTNPKTLSDHPSATAAALRTRTIPPTHTAPFTRTYVAPLTLGPSTASADGNATQTTTSQPTTTTSTPPSPPTNGTTVAPNSHRPTRTLTLPQGLTPISPPRSPTISTVLVTMSDRPVEVRFALASMPQFLTRHSPTAGGTPFVPAWNITAGSKAFALAFLRTAGIGVQCVGHATPPTVVCRLPAGGSSPANSSCGQATIDARVPGDDGPLLRLSLLSDACLRMAADDVHSGATPNGDGGSHPAAAAALGGVLLVALLGTTALSALCDPWALEPLVVVGALAGPCASSEASSIVHIPTRILNPFAALGAPAAGLALGLVVCAIAAGNLAAAAYTTQKQPVPPLIAQWPPAASKSVTPVPCGLPLPPSCGRALFPRLAFTAFVLSLPGIAWSLSGTARALVHGPAPRSIAAFSIFFCSVYLLTGVAAGTFFVVRFAPARYRRRQATMATIDSAGGVGDDLSGKGRKEGRGGSKKKSKEYMYTQQKSTAKGFDNDDEGSAETSAHPMAWINRHLRAAIVAAPFPSGTWVVPACVARGRVVDLQEVPAALHLRGSSAGPNGGFALFAAVPALLAMAVFALTNAPAAANTCEARHSAARGLLLLVAAATACARPHRALLTTLLTVAELALAAVAIGAAPRLSTGGAFLLVLAAAIVAAFRGTHTLLFCSTHAADCRIAVTEAAIVAQRLLGRAQTFLWDYTRRATAGSSNKDQPSYSARSLTATPKNGAGRRVSYQLPGAGDLDESSGAPPATGLGPRTLSGQLLGPQLQLRRTSRQSLDCDSSLSSLLSDPRGPALAPFLTLPPRRLGSSQSLLSDAPPFFVSIPSPTAGGGGTTPTAAAAAAATMGIRRRLSASSSLSVTPRAGAGALMSTGGGRFPSVGGGGTTTLGAGIAAGPRPPLALRAKQQSNNGSMLGPVQTLPMPRLVISSSEDAPSPPPAAAAAAPPPVDLSTSNSSAFDSSLSSSILEVRPPPHGMLKTTHGKPNSTTAHGNGNSSSKIATTSTMAPPSAEGTAAAPPPLLPLPPPLAAGPKPPAVVAVAVTAACTTPSATTATAPYIVPPRLATNGGSPPPAAAAAAATAIGAAGMPEDLSSSTDDDDDWASSSSSSSDF